MQSDRPFDADADQQRAATPVDKCTPCGAQHPGSASPVSDQELIATVARMEARLGTHSARRVADLMETYRALVARFEADLSHSCRDLALAKASALMLIQEVARSEDAG